MSTYLFLYKGYTTPTPEIGAAWSAWFADHGHRMVDSGNPMSQGAEVTRDAVETIAPGLESFTGYSILTAESMDEAVEIAKTNPMITSVVVYELAKM
ncbi:hypothetical protein GCM10022200_30840 [Microbacterium awajiense]|uniref:YCII-related domain-containing protein n=1 Tax=Microbacterium awajiense TaxID=415214 RepID=A0ABP7B0Z1_9MICO